MADIPDITDTHAEELRRTLLSAESDPRVLYTTLYDRVCRLREHLFSSEQECMAYARETLQVYTPIAEKLGMGLLKRDLEDLAFLYAYPQEYHAIVRQRDAVTAHDADAAAMLRDTLAEALRAAGIRGATVEVHHKTVYGFYRKLLRKRGDIAHIYDVSTVRIVVPEAVDCYRVLGIVHAHWRPVPGRTKDYIAFPKTNGYQSFHTTVYVGSSTIGIRIRTHEMDDQARYGIIAGVIDTLDTESATTAADAAMQHPAHWWFRSLVNTCKQLSDPHDVLACLAGDFFTDSMCVFTAENEPIYLPVNASVLDCAYAMDPSMGEQAVSAVVNGKPVPLGFILANGDHVALVTDTQPRPIEALLSSAHTTHARSQIQHAIAACV